MTVSDHAVRSFHGKQGGQTDILKAWVFVREVYRLSWRIFFFSFFFCYPPVFVPLSLTNTVVGHGKEQNNINRKKSQQKTETKH